MTKSRHTLELFSGSTLLRTYPVGLGMNPVDPKRRQWDLCTPEGHYLICAKNPNSKYTLGLVLNYPNADDARRGVREGLISASEGDAILAALKRGECPPMNTPLGGDIVIHGRGAGNDWTAGCVALEDGDVRELYGAVDVGTPVEIRH